MTPYGPSPYGPPPEAIRVDNGPPFGSVALGGLSQLSVWWIEQGIRVEFMGRTDGAGRTGPDGRGHSFIFAF